LPPNVPFCSKIHGVAFGGRTPPGPTGRAQHAPIRFIRWKANDAMHRLSKNSGYATGKHGRLWVWNTAIWSHLNQKFGIFFTKLLRYLLWMH